MTEEPQAVIDILGSDLTAHGYESQSTVPGDGTWVSDETSIGASIGTAEGDPDFFGEFDGPYVWVFVS